MVFQSAFPRMLLLVLMMLPVAAHGEWVLSFFGLSEMGANLHFNGEQDFYQKPSIEGSADCNFRDMGWGLGVTYWFRRAAWLGLGLDETTTKVGDATTKLDAGSLYVLLRLPKGLAFLHGTIVPYAGIGASYQALDGDVALFSGEDKVSYSVKAWGFFGKIGLEWDIVGPLAVFLEARYYAPVSYTYDKTDETYWHWEWWLIPIPVTDGEDTTHLDAQLRHAQVSLGIAWHF
jgi:hypothetical protein